MSAHDSAPPLGDFTTTWRVVPLSLAAAGVGLVSAFLALALLRLIGLFTNLSYFGRWRFDLVSPAGHTLGVWAVGIPIVGALMIGLMARYGSEKIRGHGIPEAIEAILLRNSLVEPKVALLKPLSSAISIGSGGPFGAEGPIIMTGGAFGSMVAQFLDLSSAERKTLLVAGAAGGMAATFATPVAAVALAVELLLFEWKPRSLIPVAASAIVATIARFSLLGAGPLFPVPPHVAPAHLGLAGFAGCALVGLSSGMLSALLTVIVYAVEDTFAKLPIHWMWWPALGATVVGVGGLIFPQALGVGYDLIGSLLQGHETTAMIAGVLLVKSIVWAVSLGSGTSGGVLAPLLMMGAALGALEGSHLPYAGAGFWALLGMGAILGGTMRAPFTAILFALELTHDFNAMLPLLVAVAIAEGFTVLVMRRSILTEKLQRRGHHLTREYAIDPLELHFVRQVHHPMPVTLPYPAVFEAWRQQLAEASTQAAMPVVDAAGILVGLVERVVLAAVSDAADLEALIQPAATVAHPDEPLRIVVLRMAESGKVWLPVVARADGRLLGGVALTDLLSARAHELSQESHRARVRRFRTLGATITAPAGQP